MQENYLKMQENYQQVMMSKMALEVKENPDKHASLKQQLYSVIIPHKIIKTFKMIIWIME